MECLKSDNEPLNVLLIAYACEPWRGSEAGTGWNMALGLARFHRVTVVTRANNQSVIERALDGRQKELPRFLYIDPPAWALKFKARRLLPVQLFYVLWQREVARHLKNFDDPFDIVHQLTFNSFEVPPFAFTAIEGKKVWGPVGGGQTVPTKMLKAFGIFGALLEWQRNLRIRLSARSKRVGRATSSCASVLFANKETKKLLVGNCRGSVGMMIDVGVDVSRFHVECTRRNHSGIRFLFAGRLEGRKGGIIALEAFRNIAKERADSKLIFVGDGPDLSRLQNLGMRYGLCDQLEFRGKISHNEMSQEFAAADVFLFPSLRDTSGAVVLEAMAAGLPVICFDHQGASLMIREQTGIKIKAHSFEQAVIDFGEAMKILMRCRATRIKMGSEARKVVESEYDWNEKVSRVSRVYLDVLRRPQAFPPAIREGDKSGAGEARS